MPVDSNAQGREGRHTVTVTPSDSADAYGNTGLDVLASPALVGIIEQAAIAALSALVDPTELTVGGSIELTHEAPTPIGERVTAVARVSSVDGRRITFDIEAEDSAGRIASGTHTRHLVDRARFLERLSQRHVSTSIEHASGSEDNDD